MRGELDLLFQMYLREVKQSPCAPMHQVWRVSGFAPYLLWPGGARRVCRERERKLREGQEKCWELQLSPRFNESTAMCVSSAN